MRIAIVIGSTRPGRKGETVARWVHDIATGRGDAEYEIVDLADVALPALDEPMHPSTGDYRHQHTRDWAAIVESYDGFVFVTPEYNHSTSGALKNALDFVYGEWNDKAAGFVSYGSAGGVRAVEHLRLIAAELQLATVRPQVALLTSTDFPDGRFTPRPEREPVLHALLDRVVAWSKALAPLRS